MGEEQTYLVLSSFPADDSFRHRSNVHQDYPRQYWIKTFVADSLRTESGHIGLEDNQQNKQFFVRISVNHKD